MNSVKEISLVFKNKYYEMICLFLGIISQIPFLPKIIFRENDVMKNCTMTRSVVFFVTQTSLLHRYTKSDERCSSLFFSVLIIWLM